MSYLERKQKYEMLVHKQGRPLIVYVTSIRPNLSASMAGDAIPQIIEQMELIPEEAKEIDFIIISNGGDSITALRIMSLLRERFDKITVLLPYVAYSAATILSLGANEIVMHPYSNLGPIDPQLTVSHNTDRGFQEHLQFSSEDLRNYVDFIRTDIGITDQQHLVSAVLPLLKDVGTLPIGNAKRSQQLSLALSEKMLSWHFTDSTKVKAIAKALNSSYYHHGYAVGRKEAKDIGLPITIPDKETETILWEIRKDFDAEMKCDDTFDVVKEIMSDPIANATISQVPIVNLPVNTPIDVANQILIQHAQSIPVTTRSSLNKKVLLASIESISLSKAVYTNISVIYWRDPDCTLRFSCSTSPSNWIEYEVQNEDN